MISDCVEFVSKKYVKKVDDNGKVIGVNKHYIWECVQNYVKSLGYYTTINSSGEYGFLGEHSNAHGKRPAAVKASQTGYLTLQTTPWTKVWVDGDPVGSTPFYKRELEPGKHTLRLVNEAERIDEKRSFVIRAGKTTKLDLKM